MKIGAYDYLLKPFEVPRLKELVDQALKAARESRKAVTTKPMLEAEDYESGIIGRSEAMQSVFKLIGQVTATEATVLITGESGTGKELVARSIFHNSQRSKRPFLAINCAAIAENLLESELFGHEKGAFTGATGQRVGKFEQCHGGTIFLDEIGDMSLATQTKILRVLQSGTFERVGGNQTVEVDVRVIAATNKPLEEAVAARQFREDLFYRLNVVRIQMPALRDRRTDIRLLVDYFLRRLADPAGKPKSIGPETLALLESYHWPGNVRELENVLRRATVVAKGQAILPPDLPAEVSHVGTIPSAPPPPSTPGTPTPQSTVATPSDPQSTSLAGLAQSLFRMGRTDPKLKVLPAVERVLVIEALKETRGNQVQAARLLGITRATLRKRIEKFGIRQDVSVN